MNLNAAQTLLDSPTYTLVGADDISTSRVASPARLQASSPVETHQQILFLRSVAQLRSLLAEADAADNEAVRS